ncbi:MAG: Ig-like domain-containing protein [Spirochaetes bacterium]|nr:Ig-like domain-containing protein [Spirochaetota bacterium]
MIFKKTHLLSFAILLLCLGACNNIFHDLKKQAVVDLPLQPEIEYVYPGDGACGIDVDKSILISFNKDMDAVSITDEAIIVSKSDDLLFPILKAVSFHERKIILIEPAIALDPNTEYTISLVEDLQDCDGLTVPSGYTWSFTTGETSDNTHPGAKMISPPQGSLNRIDDVAIWIHFDENIIPDESALNACFTVEKNDGTPVPGTVSYSIVTNNDAVSGSAEFVARFTPDPGFVFEKNSEYIASVVGCVDTLCLTDLAGNEADVLPWHFRTGTVRMDLVDAKNINNGSGTFGDIDGDAPGSMQMGQILLTDDGRFLSDVLNRSSLASIFDEGVSGCMADGKYLRIVANGMNVMRDLGLTPVRKFLPGRMQSPGKNEFYLDPLYGIFVLPRPVYWSRCENDSSILSPEIYEYGFNPSINRSGVVFADGIFGSAWGKTHGTWDESLTSIKPFGDYKVDFLHKGTLSVWWRPISVGQCRNEVYIYITNETYMQASYNPYGALNTVAIYCNSATPSAAVSGLITNEVWNHLYLIWDADGFEQDTSHRIKIFINDNEPVVTNDKIEGEYYFSVGVLSARNIGSGSSSIDNLKIWNHVVTEDHEWEYKGGSGRENALHVIYGPDDIDQECDYRPKLVGPDSGVGYYYLP